MPGFGSEGVLWWSAARRSFHGVMVLISLESITLD